MSRPDIPIPPPEDFVWAVGAYESRLHLVGTSNANRDEVEARCTHRVRHVIGAWTTLPNIDGYVLCEPCCVAANVHGLLTGPAMTLDEALRLPTAISGEHGRHSTDRPTELIPAVDVVDESPTAMLPLFKEALDAVSLGTVPLWPETDPDDGESTSGDGAPGSEEERSWQTSPARLVRCDLPGTVGDRTWEPAPRYRSRHALWVGEAAAA